MPSPIRLRIVAADPLVRSGLAMLLDEEDSCEVIHAAGPALYSSGDVADQPLEGDVILWDMGWESAEGDSLDFRDLSLPVIALVGEDGQAVEAWRAGALGIVTRETEPLDLLPAFKAVLSGLIVLDSQIAQALLPTLPVMLGDVETAPTARELEVLRLLAEGLTNRAIAAQLQISEHTVKFHVNGILNKLGAQSRTEAVVTATKLGFISL